MIFRWFHDDDDSTPGYHTKSKHNTMQNLLEQVEDDSTLTSIRELLLFYCNFCGTRLELSEFIIHRGVGKVKVIVKVKDTRIIKSTSLALWILVLNLNCITFSSSQCMPLIPFNQYFSGLGLLSSFSNFGCGYMCSRNLFISQNILSCSLYLWSRDRDGMFFFHNGNIVAHLY